jgi:branched-chain amino acid aminotransferase
MSRPEYPNIDVVPVAQRVAPEQRQRILANPQFGAYFSEHMVTIPWSQGAWQRGSLVPFGPLTLSPATSSLHYGQAIFEGLKAYRHADGRVFAFRPRMNAQRFASSARRLAMPELPAERFLEAMEALVHEDRDWIPSAAETSLYIRPLMFATEAALGVRPANEYLLVMFSSPVGAYFPRGMAPVNLWISTEHVRAAPFGTGAAKCAGNYAASLEAQALAKTRGCEQVLYLDATQRKFVEELGGMNFFMVLRSGQGLTLVTPDLSSGTLLAGVTRDSILRLAPDLGYRVEERPISVEELQRAADDGTLSEAFACGTAAVVTPIGSLSSAHMKVVLNDGKTGAVTQALRDQLIGIQYGQRPDPYGWLHPIV